MQQRRRTPSTLTRFSLRGANYAIGFVLQNYLQSIDCSFQKPVGKPMIAGFMAQKFEPLPQQLPLFFGCDYDLQMRLHDTEAA